MYSFSFLCVCVLYLKVKSSGSILFARRRYVPQGRPQVRHKPLAGRRVQPSADVQLRLQLHRGHRLRQNLLPEVLIVEVRPWERERERRCVYGIESGWVQPKARGWGRHWWPARTGCPSKSQWGSTTRTLTYVWQAGYQSLGRWWGKSGVREKSGIL